MYFQRWSPGWRRGLVRVFLCATTYISGCGKDDRTAQADQSLEEQLPGVWRSECFELSPDRFELLKVEFKPSGKFFVFQTLFSDKKCEKVSDGSIALVGSYSVVESTGVGLNEALGNKDGKISWKFSTIEISATQESFASELNDQNYCGVSDWSTNQPVELAGRQCQYFDEVEVKYPLLEVPVVEPIEVVGNKLYLNRWFRFNSKISETKRFLRKD